MVKTCLPWFLCEEVMEGVPKSSPFLSKEFFSFHFNLLKTNPHSTPSFIFFLPRIRRATSRLRYETSLCDMTSGRQFIWIHYVPIHHLLPSTVILALFRHFSAEKCQSSQLKLFHFMENKQAGRSPFEFASACEKPKKEEETASEEKRK